MLFIIITTFIVNQQPVGDKGCSTGKRYPGSGTQAGWLDTRQEVREGRTVPTPPHRQHTPSTVQGNTRCAGTSGRERGKVQTGEVCASCTST